MLKCFKASDATCYFFLFIIELSVNSCCSYKLHNLNQYTLQSAKMTKYLFLFIFSPFKTFIPKCKNLNMKEFKGFQI